MLPHPMVGSSMASSSLTLTWSYKSDLLCNSRRKNREDHPIEMKDAVQSSQLQKSQNLPTDAKLKVHKKGKLSIDQHTEHGKEDASQRDLITAFGLPSNISSVNFFPF